VAKTGKKVHFGGNFKVRNSKSTPPSQRNSKSTPFSLSVWCGKNNQKKPQFLVALTSAEAQGTQQARPKNLTIYVCAKNVRPQMAWSKKYSADDST